MKNELLSENYNNNFCDFTKEDLEFLLSEKGKSAVTALHVEGIKSFIKSL